MRRLAGPLLAVLLVLPAAAASAQTEAVTFGDSLTHNDLLGLVYRNPQDLYGADPMEAAFHKASRPGDDLTSYAIAGSTSDDIATQIDLYEFFRALRIQQPATVIGYEIGGNDLLDHVGLLAASAPGEDPAADAVIDALVANLQATLARLAATHPGARAVIWTVPDVSVTPRYFGAFSPGEIANLQAHTERANAFIRGLAARPGVVVVDVYHISQEAVANPPVIFGRQLVPPPARGGYDHLFADEIHPTAVSNAIVANFIIGLVNRKWGLAIPPYTESELADLARIPH